MAFLLCLGLIGAWRVSARATADWQVWVGAGYLGALIALHLWYFGRSGRARQTSAAFLLAEALLVYLPIVQFPWWLGLPGILAGSMLLLLRPWAGVPLAVAVVVSFGWYGAAVAEGGAAASGGRVFTAVFDAVTTLMTALVVYGLTRLADLVRDLHGARGELARLAVAEERLGFARDLQGLLGVQLSAIAARTERISRLPADRARERVRAELAEILGISRKALADVRSVARAEPCPRFTAGRVPAVSRRLANGVVTAVFVAFGTIILADVLINQRDLPQAALGAGCLAIVLGVQVAYFIRPGPQAHPGLSLAVQCVFVYLPVLQYGGLWLTMPSFLAANAWLVLRPAVSVPASLAVLASVGCLYASVNPAPLDIAGEVAWALTNMVAVYGMTRLALLVAELNTARGELARMAVAEERLRFARDVHDLLGLSLSAVTLKAELANRLLVEYPERAREQLAEIAVLSRKAIGDVRSVAGGYQEFELAEELCSARSVLSSAEIDVQISGFDFEIPEPLSTVLAAVAREGVTNVLRHSKAERCEITVRRAPDGVRMEIVNDGLAGAVIDGDGTGGHGIRNLIHRVRQLGGELAVGVEPNGTYRLLATVPLAA